MLRRWHRCGLPNASWVTFLAAILSAWSAVGTKAQAPSGSTQSPQPASSQEAEKPVSQSQTQEIASHDSPATCKVRVNLVFVRVVVRDSNGKVISNLKKEDFELADNRKLQIISTFAAETPGSHVATVKMDKDFGSAPTEGIPVKPTELPQRFITLFFDDLHLNTQDALLSRQAATKLLAAMKTGDRLSIYTSSGQVQQDFTSERGKLEETLRRILPRPLSGRSSSDCPPMTYYEAYQIVEVNDPTALQVATMDAAACWGTAQGASQLAQMAAQQEYSAGGPETQFSFRNLDGLIARMRSLPGQRIIIMASASLS